MPQPGHSRRSFVTVTAATVTAATVTAGTVAAGTVGLPAAVAAPRQPPSAGPGRQDAFSPADFVRPPKDSRPTVYWYWNGPVTPELVDTQLADLRAKGMHEVVLFPYDNDEMRPAFFSEGWFDIVGHLLETAERHGMRVWIFNDDHFPTGRAAYYIVNGGKLGPRTFEPRPDLRLKALWRSTCRVSGPATVKLAETTGVAVDTGSLAVDATVLGGAAVLSAGAAWGDCTVTASAKPVGVAAGLVIRASADGTDGYAVEFDQTGVVTVTRLAAGRDPVELAHSERTDGFNKTKFHTLRVTVEGPALTVTLDDVAKAAVTDATHAAGSVGVRATGTQRSLWESLRVTAPDGGILHDRVFDDPAAAGDFPPLPRPAGTRPAVAAAALPAKSADIADAVDLTDRLGGDGTWRVPAGDWLIHLYGGTELVDDSQGYSRGYVDLLADEPGELLIDIVPGEYHRRFGRYFGNVVPGFWDDEPFFASAQVHFQRLPWSPPLAGALDRLGTVPSVAYTAAFDDLGRGGRIARGAYWRAVSDRFAAFFQKQSAWYERRGVSLITNPLYDETSPAKRIVSTGDLHKINQWAQVPGGDVITAEYEFDGPTMTPRNPASVAHQRGRPRVLMESFGNMGWQVAPEFVRALVGAHATRGVNLTVLHALWTDETKVFFPPPFGPRAPWWWAMAPVAEWIGRVMEAARGTSAARTALLQPQRAAEQWQGTEEQGAVDSAFDETAYALERGQIDFDLLHEGALSGDTALLDHARVAHGVLTVGQARYAAVVLPLTPTLDVASVRKLTDFARGGGTVVAVGELPAQDAAARDRSLGHALTALFGDRPDGSRRLGTGTAIRVPDTTGVAAAVRAAGVAAAELEPAAESVRVLRTTRGHDTAFLLCNESADTVTTTATLPAEGVPEVWDPETGATGQATVHRTDGAGRVRLPLTLGPYRTLAVVVRAGTHERPHLTRAGLPVAEVRATGKALRVTTVAERPGRHALTGTDGTHTYHGTVTVTDALSPVPLDGDWTRLLDRDGATPVTGPLAGWDGTDPLFSGSGVYRTSHELTAAVLKGRGFLLDLGTVREVAGLTVNGHTLPPLLWAPFAADVTELLRPGRNTFEVKVSNTLSNERNKPLPSGLLGPVALRPYRRTVTLLRRA